MMLALCLWVLISMQARPGSPPPASTITVAASSVRGTVVNGQTSAPVADARVTLVELAQSAVTAPDGRFEFTNVAPGRYTLSVSTIGFIFVRRRIDLAANTVVDLSVPLAEGTGTYQESVTVSASPQVMRDPGTSTAELGSASLQDLRGVAADDPVRAMQALPGAASGDDFQSQFSVRGSSFRDVGIVIDGTSTPLLFHAVRGTDDSGSVAMINTDMLSHASLSAGSHPQRNGDWLGATLEFDTREGSRDRLGFRGSASGTSASVVVDGPVGPGKRGSWIATIRKSYVDWLVRKIDPQVDSTIGFSDTQGKLVYDLTSRQQLQFFVIAGDATYLRTSATGSNSVQRATSKSLLSSLFWRYTREHLLFSQRVAFVANKFQVHGPATQELGKGNARAWVLRSDVAMPLNRAWSLEGGLKGEWQRDGQTLRDFVVTAGKLRLRSEQGAAGIRAIGGLWSNVAYRGTGGSFAAGVRVATDTDTQTVVAPWLMAERHAGAVTFVGSLGRTNQFPTIFELAQGTTAIRPEHANAADAGLSISIGAGITARTVFFRRRESNVLRRVQEDKLVDGKRVTAAPFPFYRSDLDGTSHGVDVVFERRASRGPTGWVSYTWAHTRHTDQATGEVFDGDFDQRDTVNIFLQQRLSYRMNATVKFRYGSNFPIVGYFAGTPEALKLGTTRNDVRLPVYARLDLKGSRTFTYQRSRLTLFVEIMNVLGRRNYGQGDGVIRTNFDAIGYTERLIPFVPSAGVLIEF